MAFADYKDLDTLYAALEEAYALRKKIARENFRDEALTYELERIAETHSEVRRCARHVYKYLIP